MAARSTTSTSSQRKSYLHYLQFSSDNFLLAAGGVLFKLAPPPSDSSSSSSPLTTPILQICVLHHKKTIDFVLPKGRKDVNETLEHAALRETFEETGYPCEFLPCTMFTRAPNPDLDTGLGPHVETECTEPFTITFRTERDGSAKVIFWYLMRVVSNSTPMVQGTQMPNEDFEPVFVEAREAVRKLTRPEYQGVAKLAVDLVENAMTMTDHRPVFNS